MISLMRNNGRGKPGLSTSPKALDIVVWPSACCEAVMSSDEAPIQHLLTLPPRMAAEFEKLEKRSRPDWFASCDPPGMPLGSGGGTANLLAEGWRATGGSKSFKEWLNQSRKLIIHGGGQSRRLPAYAPTGKLLMPIP